MTDRFRFVLKAEKRLDGNIDLGTNRYLNNIGWYVKYRQELSPVVNFPECAEHAYFVNAEQR